MIPLTRTRLYAANQVAALVAVTGPSLPPGTPSAWYNFADATARFTDSARTTPALADTDPVGGITDKSGNSLHLAASSGDRATLKLAIQNGLDVARFDGAANFMESVANVPMRTIYMVLNHREGSVFGNYPRPIDGDNSVVQLYGTASTTTYAHPGTLRVNGAVTDDASPLVDFKILTFQAASLLNTSHLFVGRLGSIGAQYLNGDVGEILCYSTAHTGGEIDDVEAWLNSRWATF